MAARKSPEFIALFDCRADDSDELSFKKGDRLKILSQDGDWWLARHSNGKIGQVPKNYLEKQSQPESRRALKSNSTHKTPSSRLRDRSPKIKFETSTTKRQTAKVKQDSPASSSTSQATVPSKIFQCGICKNPYTEKKRTPHILKACGHTFCQPCLKKQKKELDGRVSCHECGQITLVQLQDCFPKNTFLLERIKEAKPASIEDRSVLSNDAHTKVKQLRAALEHAETIVSMGLQSWALIQNEGSHCKQSLSQSLQDQFNVFFAQLELRRCELQQQASSGPPDVGHALETAIEELCLAAPSDCLESSLESSSSAKKGEGRRRKDARRQAKLEELYLASGSGDIERLTTALNEFRNLVNSRHTHPERERSMALHQAARYGQLKAIELLVEYGSQGFCDGDFFGRTPVHEAAARGHERAIELLFRLGKETKGLDGTVLLDTRDKKGCTPMHYAARHCQMEAIEMLARLGSQAVNSADESGSTPLLEAAIQGDFAIVELLIRLGNNETIDTPAANGKTPLQAAAENGHAEVVELLVSSGSKALDTLKDSMHDAAVFDRTEVIETLVQSMQPHMTA